MDKLGKHIPPILSALLLTVALVGCRQEPLPATGDAIQFSVSSAEAPNAPTKAALTDKSYLIKKDNIATLYGSWKVGSGTPTTVFNGAELKCTAVSETSPQWSYGSTLKYWVKGATYDFRAVFPSTVSSTWSAGQVNVSYDSSSGYDLMVASAPNVDATTQMQMTGTEKAVKLKFRHACAAVRFIFEDASGGGNYYINSFELQDLYTKGTLQYVGNSATSEVTYGDTDKEWKYTGSRAKAFSWEAAPTASPAVPRWNVPLPPTSPASYSSAYTVNGSDRYYIVPQTLNDTSVLYFTYSVGADGTQAVPVTLPLKVSGEGYTVNAWAPGKEYTYKIQLKANAINFTVTWADWVDGDTQNLTE